MQDELPILLVAHDADGNWQFLDGGNGDALTHSRTSGDLCDGSGERSFGLAGLPSGGHAALHHSSCVNGGVQ